MSYGELTADDLLEMLIKCRIDLAAAQQDARNASAAQSELTRLLKSAELEAAVGPGDVPTDGEACFKLIDGFDVAIQGGTLLGEVVGSIDFASKAIHTVKR